MGLWERVEFRRHHVARRGTLGDGQRSVLPDGLEHVQHICAEMAGKYFRRERLGLVLYRGRREHFPELHSTPGGEPCRSARWDVRRHSDFVGGGDGRPGGFYEFRICGWNEPMSCERSGHI